MKQAEKIWKRRWRTVCGIILLQVFLCPLFATNLQLKDGGILIVNANSDLSPLCNHIISELIHRGFLTEKDWKKTDAGSKMLFLT